MRAQLACLEWEQAELHALVDVLRAEATTLKRGDFVRIASDDNALAGTMRWEYGKVVKVHSGKELLDVDFDNGEQMRAMPTVAS